jgi:plastocyanin
MNAVRPVMLILLATSVAIVGCKPDPAVEKATLIDRGTKKPVPPPDGESMNLGSGNGSSSVAPANVATGSVAGAILFMGKPPVMPVIDTSMDPACGMGGAGKFTAEQYIVNNGKLANVFVYVKSGPQAAMMSGQVAAPVVLDQKGCRYIPHVIGVQQGGYVEFRNSDLTMHNIHTMPTEVGNETIDISEGPKGAPVVKQMQKPELMMPVRCNNHPWMNAFINIAATPFFAVTGPDGKFDLRGLPPGDYVIGAVQEKMGEKTMNVHVGANAATKADFSFAAK